MLRSLPSTPLIVLILLGMIACEPNRPVYDSLFEYPVYALNDLGVKYSPEKTTFKLWSPPAHRARVRIFDSDAVGTEPIRTLDMDEVNGAWTVTDEGNLEGLYYTYQVRINGNWNAEAIDPYARAAGTNGLRGQIVNLNDTDPPGWDTDKRPPFTQVNDAVIYELHIRDLSMDPSSGIQHKGKFLGLTERGTRTPAGVSTGLDHLVEMGITHVHLLPIFDFLSVDESRPDEAQYNWGYDPQNYNLPEGSYSTDPSDGKVRIRELKEMVMALHGAGIRVVMDVVYNHTGRSEDSHFQKLIPDYFYRFREDGTMSNASGCGNEIASERPMVRKFIRESLTYWAREYHIDGFRFDLMGIHDIATMNDVSRTLQEVIPGALIYGEGWAAGESPLADSLRATKANAAQLDRVAVFSDDIRDGIKGSVFEHETRGFATGAKGLDQTIRFGVVAATEHPQIIYDSVNYSFAPWAPQPIRAITYASCHDNHTLWDRMALSNPGNGYATRQKMQRLALGIVLTSQGIPFLHAGTEFCRSKQGDENSYKSGDKVNAIKWQQKGRHEKTVEYVKGLIQIRKNHPAFRMGSTAAIQERLEFFETGDDQLVGFRIAEVPDDEWSTVLVYYNGSPASRRVALPDGKWKVVVKDGVVNEAGIGRPLSLRLRIAGSSMVVLVQA